MDLAAADYPFLAERKSQASPAARSEGGDGGPAAGIAKAKRLLDGNAITPAEFDVLKATALA